VAQNASIEKLKFLINGTIKMIETCNTEVGMAQILAAILKIFSILPQLLH